ncbi:MAG: heavy metal translocating P-type ATPase, partial [Gemmata sp.]
VSEAAARGEPFAVARRPGDRVLAGSASFDSTFRIEATAPGTAREIDRLLRAVEEARDAPLSLQARADRLGRWFLPLAAAAAAGTFAYWALCTAAGWEAALFNSMSVLLVACPCVIGLATPVVIWSALNRLAERGLIVRAGDVIERLAEVDRVMVDKTGTLTDDRFALVSVETFCPEAARAQLLGWLSLVQGQSSHPVAKPFADLPRPFAPGAGPRVEALTAVPGCGVSARLVEGNGTRHEVKVGTPEWVGGPRPSDAATKTVHVSVGGELAAVATVRERLRESAAEAVEHFGRIGLSVEVVTGDTAARAEALRLPGVSGGLLPDDKRAAVERAKAGGARPLFVGDGINDASALAAAHVGVALASGTDLAVSAAPVTLYGGDLSALPWAVELSRAAVRAVRRNLARAVAYNLVGMALAACGVLHPVVAALLMVASSFTLLWSAARVRAEPPPPAPPPLGAGAGGGGCSLAHALALALQGVVLLLLLAPLREPRAAALTLAAFALAGGALGLAWRRYAVPHWLDMCAGMLTAGNLGMLLGWWADAGFAPLARACCTCAEASGGLWMWVGMLALANAAMRLLARCPPPSRAHAAAMYTGGNAGMALGMLLGGWCAGRAEVGHQVAAVALSFAGMTVGMTAGMLAGTWLCERLYAYFLTK